MSGAKKPKSQPEAPPQPSTATRVFLSYSRKDTAFCKWLRERLESDGIEVFRDVDDTLPGEEWWARLQSLMSRADSIVFVLSPNSVASAVCKGEVKFASGLNKRIFPIVIAEVDWNAVPDGLSKIHSVMFKDEGAHEASLRQLLAALRTDIEWVREHTRLGELAARWAKANTDDELLRGQELQRAEAWLARQPGTAPAPTREHYAFIKASRDAADRRRRRLVGIAIAAVLFVAAAAAGLLFLSLRGNERALMAQLLDRSSQIGALLDGPGQIEGLIAAIEAANASRGQFGTIIPGIRGGLLNALERAREIDRWSDPGPQVIDLTVSGDGKQLLLLYRRNGDEQGPSVPFGGVWSLSSPRQRTRIDVGPDVSAGALCRSGRCFSFRLPERTVVVDTSGRTIWQTTEDASPGAIDTDPDGRTLYVGFASGAVSAIDLATSTARTLVTAKEPVTTLAVSHTGKIALVAGEDEARLVDLASGEAEIYTHGCGSSLVVEADGRSFLCYRRGGAIMRFSKDSPDGTTIAQTGFPDPNSLATARDGTVAVASGNGAAIEVLSSEGAPRLQGRIFAGETGRIAFVPPGDRLVEIGYLDNEIKLFDVGATALATTRVDVGADARTVSFCADGERVAWGAFNGRVGFAGRDGTSTGWQDQEEQVSQVHCLPGSRLLSAGGAIRIWSTPTQRVTIAREDESFRTVIYEPEASHVIATSGKGVWNVPFTGEPRKLYDVGLDDIWRSLLDTKAGSVVLGSSGSGWIEVRSLAGVKTAGPFRAHIGFVNALATTDWPGTFASGGTLGTGKLQSLSLWDFAGTQRRTVSAHRAVVTGIAFDRASRLLATVGDDGAVRLWDESLRKVGPDLLRLSDPALGISAAPAGGRLAVASGNAIYFLETSDDALLRRACDRLARHGRFVGAHGEGEKRVLDICAGRGG